MAFLFNGYQTTDDSQNQKQNIFSQGTSTQSAAGDGEQTDVVSKTRADGSSTAPSSNVSRGTSGTSSSTTQGVTSGSGGYNPKAAQSAYSRISQSLQLPTKTLGGAQSAIQGAQQKLQSESDRYAASGQQQAQSYKLDSETIKGAVRGDEKAYQTTAQRLTSARPEVEAFKGLGTEGAPDVSAVRDASRAYAPEAGPNYSAGQSRFDAALLRRNPEYLRMQQQILGDAKRLNEANDKAIEEKTAQQRAALENAYNESTSDIRKQIEGLGGEVVSAARSKEAAEDARRAALSESDIATQEYAKLREKIRADLKTADPRSQQYRAAQYLDSLSPAELSQYVNVDRDTDYREFIDKAGADQYNRAMGLLGRSDMLTASEMGAGADYQFDEGSAYRRVLDQITGRRAEADRVAQDQIAAIQASAAARAAQRQQDIAAQLDAIRPQYDQLRRDVILPIARNDAAPNLSWTDVLTPEEAAQLNALEQDLAVVNPGNYQVSSANPYADLKAMQDDLRRYQEMQAAGGMTGIPINPSGPVPRPATPDVSSGSRASGKNETSKQKQKASGRN